MSTDLKWDFHFLGHYFIERHVMIKLADISTFEALGNFGHGGGELALFNAPEDVEQIRQAAKTYRNILNNTIRKATRLLETKGEYEKAQTDWTTAKNSYESGKKTYKGIYETVKKGHVTQADYVTEAKEKNDLEPYKTYLTEDNTIREIAMSVFAKDSKLTEMIKQM